ncbi:SdrD B-like domain-containing protein, partial [Runella limosa]|uniref:SdrD B-like domain-containing protein n=1 Tax=Runella limosa TaxID=370978 RepID=UPI0005691CB5
MKKYIYIPSIYPKIRRLFYLTSLLLGTILCAKAQVTISLDYKEKNNLTTVQSGDKYTLQLDYSVSSTTGNASNVKAVINLPDNIYTVGEFVGTTHAPVANFVFTNTVGAKKLTINFINPVPSGSTGVLEFIVRTNNLTTPNNTQLCTTAEITDGSGATSGVKNHCMTVTAIPRICALKTVFNGGAIDNITTYRVRVSANGGSNPLFTPFGTLQATNITVTDNLPANVEFISAKVYNVINGAEVGTGTYSAGVVTASIPNLSLRQYGNGTWESFYYNLDIQVKFNSPTFSASDVVTNTATVAYTPLTGTASVLNDGDNVGGCVSDLTETTTLATPVTSAVLTKSAGSNVNAYPGQRFSYTWSFTNTGNTPLENVEIIETIPANVVIDQDAEYNGVRVLEWEDVDHIEYQTNVSGSTWVVLADGSGVPDLPSGTLFTKLKFVLKTPFPPGASLLPNNHILHFKSLTEVTTTETVTNCMEWTSTTAGIPDQAGRTACNSSVKLLPRPTTAKAIYNAGHLSNCSQAIGGTVTFTGMVIADVGYADGTNPVCALLIPAGFTYVPGSETFTANNSGITTPPTLEIIPNYITTGGKLRDLYRWTFPSGTVLPHGERFSVNVSVKISPALAAGSYNADFIATFSNASVNEPDYNFGNFVDTKDWDLDGNTTETVGRANSGYGQCDINIAASASMESIKWVKGLCDVAYSRYPAFGQTVPGGDADYRLIIKNTGNVVMKDIKIIDILPFIGDRGVIDPQARQTQWRPNLANPISAPAGVTVYYTTVSNPCRDEVKQPADPSPFPTGCTPPNWSVTPPLDITQVQAVKIDFGTKTLAGGDSLVFSWPMRAPVDAPTNDEIAWNSFGFVATRSDNNQPLLAAEPIKVGIKLKPIQPAVYGDYVWIDTNKNGIQDDGATGVSGVRVELYKDNGDGISDPATDLFVGFTVTDGTGKYLFSTLQPGDYFAKFYPPAGYVTTTSNQGGNDALDSDGIITIVTTLDAGEDDRTWDLGIYQDTNCDVKITNYTLSPCVWTGTASEVTVNVFVAWANAPSGQNINVVLNGVTQTIDLTTATSPALVSFTLPANNTDYVLNAVFSGTSTCKDSKTIRTPLPCEPAVCVLNIDAVNVGACKDGKAPLDIVVSWSNNPAGENIVVTAGDSTRIINVSGGVLSPVTVNFNMPSSGQVDVPISVGFQTTTACKDTDKFTLPNCICIKPNAGNDVSVCAPATTAKLTATTAGGTWAPIGSPANPAAATIDANGNVTGMTVAGTYRFVYSVSGLNCTDTAQVVVNAKPNIADGSATICAGESVNLTSRITNYATYLSPVWTVGTASGTAVATPTSVTPTGTTTYVLVAQNALGCKDTANVVVTVNPKPNAGKDTTLVCVNAATNTLATSYTLVPSPAGGTWAQLGTTPATATITGNNVTNMTVVGTYQFIYTTVAGCKDTVAVTVAPCAGCVKPNAGSDAAAVCQPTSTAKLTAVTTGGTWAPIGSPANPSAASIDANGNITGLNAAGTYRFVYSITSGGQTCTDTAQVVVNAKPNIADGSATICAGESVNLTSRITNYATYLSPVWTVGTASGTAVATPTSVTPTGTTTYVLVAQNALGCKDTANVVVTVNPKPNAGKDTTLVCVNAATNTLATSYTLVPSPAGGTWAQLGTTPATATITGNNVTGMTVAGTYQFIYTTTAGCKDTVAVTVAPCAGCVKPNAGSDAAAVCQPTSTAKLTALTTGGTWAPIGSPANPSAASIDANGNITGLNAAGTYRFVYSITSGGQTCTDTAQVVVNAKPNIADGSATICAGESVNLTSRITNYATYLSPVWTVGTASGTAVATPTSVTPTGTTTYVLVAQNALGCKDTANVVVTVNAKPNAGKDTTLVCVNAATNTLATSYTLVPSPAGGTWAQLGTTPATATITGNNVTNMTVAGTYQFIYTTTAGCKDTVAVTVAPCAGCVKPNAGSDAASVCQPTSTAKLTALTTGGTWAPIGSPANPSAASIDANGNITGLNAAGTYRFVYSITSGGQTCTDTAQVVVNAKPNIADGSATICAGESVNLTSRITNYATYLSPVWTVGTASGTAVATPTSVTPTGTTTYVLVAQNAAGCKDTANVVVTVNAKPNAGKDTTLVCVNAATNTLATSYTLVPSPAGGTWAQLGTTPATATITGNNVTGMTVAGTYQFIYTTTAGCK